MTTGAVTVTANGPPPAGASPLQALLHPLTPQRFLQAYWQQQPLQLTGWADRFRGLFDRAALARALARQHECGLLVRVSRDHEGDGGGGGAHTLIDAGAVAEQLQAGSSVCVDPIDRADPALAELASSLKAEVGHAGPVTVKCYLSPAGYGFNTHFDAHVVTTLQIEGCKRWRVSPAPGVAFPLDNAFLDAAGEVRYVGRRPSSLRSWETPPVDRDAFTEVVLRPGDVLCLPAGTWHDAKASDGHSLALNVAFPPADALGFLADLVRGRLQEQPRWRGGVPAAQPMPDGGSPAAVRAYLAERVEELVDALRSAVAGPDLAAHWAAAVRGAPGHAAPTGGGLAMGAVAPRGAATPAGGRLQVVLGVADADRAAAWYGRVLGCRLLSAIPEFGWVELSTAVPGVSLGLTELDAGTGGGAVLDFGVDDLERMRGVLADNGVTVTDPISEIAGVARFLLAQDLDGNRLMFFEPDDRARGGR